MFTRSKWRKECETEAPQLARRYLDAGGSGGGGRHVCLSPMDVPLPLCTGAATRRASGRGLAMPLPRGRGTVRCGMLPPLRQGELHRDCCGPLSGRLAAEGDVMKKPKARLDAWADAQKRFHLSDRVWLSCNDAELTKKQQIIV